MDEPSMQAETNASGGASERSIGELVSTIMEQISSLVRGEIDYALANAKAKGSEIGTGGVLFAVAGVVALFGVSMLLFAAAAAIATVLPWWAAFLIVGAALLAIAGILALVGKSHLDKSKDYEIDPKAGVDRSIDAVKTGFRK